jgi:hypothetical protein
LHFAITKKTAAEIIHSRADSTKPNMGLTNWKNSPTGKIRKNDVAIAKNYLDQDEIDGLNRIVSMYLDYAENQAKMSRAMTMQDWINKLNAFLQFNEQEILTNSGKISAEKYVNLYPELVSVNLPLSKDVSDSIRDYGVDRVRKDIIILINKKLNL